MRVVDLPVLPTVLLDVAAWFVVHMGTSLLALWMPDRWFARDSRLYRSRPWEQDGRFYERWFRIRRWKDRLPDGGRFFRAGFSKRNLAGRHPGYLSIFLLESRRGELTHWIAVLPAPLFFLWNPPGVGWFMLGYALFMNLPCILVQRYNRPRFRRLLERSENGTAAIPKDDGGRDTDVG